MEDSSEEAEAHGCPHPGEPLSTPTLDPTMATGSWPSNYLAAVEAGQDRRSGARYPVSLQLRYKPADDYESEQLGYGRTIDISSRGVLFEADNLIPVKRKIELALDWPVRLDGSCFLQLVMRGAVVRLDNNRIAVRSDCYEFRTASANSFASDGQSGLGETNSWITGVAPLIGRPWMRSTRLLRDRRPRPK